jgi:SSS family solute:Na+ symporter
MTAALGILIGTFALALGLGLLARGRRRMTLHEWSVASRGFGGVLVFLLMAGEIYTTFTFLGGSGWAYGKGAPAYYILCYGTVAYAMSYFLLPPIWRYATEHSLVSQADFFASKYGSRPLGVLVAIVSVIALVPYLVLQLKGLGIIISESSYGRVSANAAVWGSTAALMLYVVVSGVRGSAWTAVLKDSMILIVAVALGIYLPLHYHGGLHAMFASIAERHPGFLTLPARGQSPWWFASTVILTALGFYMWPHSFASTYTARDENVFRKNAMVLPLYQLVLLFVFFCGFAAIAQVPGLTGSEVDLSLLRLSKLAFTPWVVGVIGAAGLLTALVPGSMLLLAAATVLAQNVVRPLKPGLGDHAVSVIARGLVPVIALVAVLLTISGNSGIVNLLLMGYNLVTQLFPALVFSLPERGTRFVTTSGAFCGILAGELTVAGLTAAHSSVATLLPNAPGAVQDLNVGIVALLVNVVVLVAVSFGSRVVQRGRAVQAEPRLGTPAA